jgi:hypothetical protein
LPSRGIRQTIWLALIVPVIVPVAFTAVSAEAQDPRPASSFVTGVLPPAPGSGTAINQDAEPGLAVDPSGTFWAVSDILPYATDDTRRFEGLFTGADVWKSTDDGATWQWVADPIAPVATQTWGLGGEDSDITVAPVKNSRGFYNIYVTSLWIGATDLVVSPDGGATWIEYQLAGIPYQDRPWMAATGPCTVYVSYHQIGSYDILVDRYDVCTAGRPGPTGTATALDPIGSTDAFLGAIEPGLTNRHGKLVVDTSPTSPFQGNVYQPLDICRDDLSPGHPVIQSSGGLCETKTEVMVAVSTDGGQTFKDYTVTETGSQHLYIWPVTMAVDSAGNVYTAWFDTGVAYLNVSHDGGKTWSPSVRINQTGSAVYPTVAADGAGEVFVAWYGTTKAGDPNDPSVMGLPNKKISARWYVYAARSDDYGQTFSITVASDVVHTGVLCPLGGGCATSAGDRNLLDDFGVQISPVTGLASVVFSNDQPDGTAGRTHTDFAKELPPPCPSPTPSATPTPSPTPISSPCPSPTL